VDVGKFHATMRRGIDGAFKADLRGNPLTGSAGCGAQYLSGDAQSVRCNAQSAFDNVQCLRSGAQYPMDDAQSESVDLWLSHHSVRSA
jgi:hypothetical protein